MPNLSQGPGITVSGAVGGSDGFDIETVETNEEVSPFIELGLTGLKRAAGYIDEEFLPELRSRKAVQVYREMGDNDAIIGTLLFALTYLLRETQWTVTEGGKSRDDANAAKFLESCMDDMSHSWGDFVAEALSCLQYGWSWHEIVYKRCVGPWETDGKTRSKYSDGLIRWRKLPIRSQESMQRWVFDENNETRGMVQMAAPDYSTRVIPINRSLLFRTGIHKGNPEGRSILRSAYRCLTPDHDVMTRRGWAPIGKIDVTDEIRVADGWATPTEIWSYEYAGDMVQAQSRFVSQLVTPNHRMWVKREDHDEFEFIDADQCGPRVSFGAQSVTAAPDAATIRIGSQDVPVDVWATFLGWWLSEGHTWAAKPGSANPSRCEVGLTQNEGPTADAIRTVVAELPWSFYERTDVSGLVRWTATRRELYDALAPVGKARVKYIPEYVFDWSARQINLLLDAYVLGDGSRIGNLKSYRGTDAIFTSSARMADDLQRAGLLAGWRAQLRAFTTNSFGVECQMYAVSLGKNFSQMRATWTTVAYEGPVHCVTVPGGRFMVRRHGKASWTGNSYFFKKRFEEHEAIGVERDLAGLPKVGVPSSYIRAKAGTDQFKMVQALQKMVRSVRRNEQEGIVFPNDYDDETRQPKFTFDLVGSGGARQFSTNEIITRLEQRMLMTCLADFILVGHEETGTYNMHADKRGIFNTALNVVIRGLADTVNRHAVPRLFLRNGWRPATLPKFKPADVDAPDLTQLAGFLAQTAGIGFTWGPDAELERYLRMSANLPELSKEGFERERILARRTDATRMLETDTAYLAAKSQLAQAKAAAVQMQTGEPTPEQAAQLAESQQGQAQSQADAAQGKKDEKRTQEAHEAAMATNKMELMGAQKLVNGKKKPAAKK